MNILQPIKVMNKNTISESYKNEILKMHGLIKEQGPGGVDDNPPTDPTLKVVDNTNDKVVDKKKEDFVKVVESKCLGGKRSDVFASKGRPGLYYIIRTTPKNTKLYFYSDMTVYDQNGKSLGQFHCPEVPSTLQGAGAQGAGGVGAQGAGLQGAAAKPPVKFSQTNLDALNELKKQGFYYMENPPSQFKVDQKEYVKLDITGKDTNNPAEYVNLVTSFSKYFPEFKESLYVYKSTPQEKTAGRGEKVEVTKESCQTAVFELERLMDEPNSFSLTNDQIVAHIQTAKRCQDKGNKLGLLNLKYNKAFKKVQDRYFKYN